MNNFALELDNLKNIINNDEWDFWVPIVQKCEKMLTGSTGQGADYLGWLNLPGRIENSLLKQIEETATRFQELADVLVVVGIGGSYLGARAVIEAFSPYSALPSKNSQGMKVIYLGNNLDTDYYNAVLKYLEDVHFCVNVISKSGTTTEPAIAFRLMRSLLKKKYGENYNRRIAATTDEKKGALLTVAQQERYETFIIPDDIGGRYSVLTPVGLLPILCAGIPAAEIIEGAADMENALYNSNFEQNPAWKYAAARRILYDKGYRIEVLASFHTRLAFFAEWWKQLFGESEGKDKKGLFPASLIYTTDLHSLGQFMQDGSKITCETFINIINQENEITLTEEDSNLDNLNYLAGKPLSFVNTNAFNGTRIAHTQGEVPNLTISLENLSPYSIGQLIYFFEKSCALSGYLLGVNPFNQPGVEQYKKEMFKLLGKP